MSNISYPPISIYIPCYNASSYILKNVIEYYNFLEKNFEDFELVIVDDNSSDFSLNKLKEFSKKNKNIKLIENDIGPTKRENLAREMLHAKFEIVVLHDQDLSVPIEFIPNLIHPLIRNKSDISIGNRYASYKPKRNLTRLVLSKTINFLLRKLFNIKVKDIFCGFKAFKRENLLNILKEMKYDYTFKRGWFWDVELLLNSEKLNYKITEIPVVFQENQKSNLNLLKEYKLFVFILLHLKNNNKLATK